MQKATAEENAGSAAPGGMYHDAELALHKVAPLPKKLITFAGEKTSG